MAASGADIYLFGTHKVFIWLLSSVWNAHASKSGGKSEEFPLQVCDSSPTHEGRYQVVVDGIF